MTQNSVLSRWAKEAIEVLNLSNETCDNTEIFWKYKDWN